MEHAYHRRWVFFVDCSRQATKFHRSEEDQAQNKCSDHLDKQYGLHKHLLICAEVRTGSLQQIEDRKDWKTA